MLLDQGRAPHSDSRTCCPGYSGASARAFDPTFRSPSRSAVVHTPLPSPLQGEYLVIRKSVFTFIPSPKH